MTEPQNSTNHSSVINKQVRFAVVMYGGVSLAIYIYGVAQELLKLVRSTAKDETEEFSQTEKVYRKIAYILSDEEHKNCYSGLSEAEVKELVGKIPVNVETSVKFVIDVLSGTSAGGINAVFLAKALANNQDIKDLKRLWLVEGDIKKLLNDKQSVAGTPLDEQREPESLLNSQRMYLKLLEAIDEMEQQPLDSRETPRTNSFNSPNVDDELDLFVTVTDYAGVPLPIRLFDRVVFERRHKQVFNFRYSKNKLGKDEGNQFTRKFNPFLAFAARCTSAFPLAFEPMRLTDTDAVIERSFPAVFSGNKSESDDWLNFFSNFNARQDTRINWNVSWEKHKEQQKNWYKGRFLVDGGYLDNKPFGYAVQTLARREAGVPVDRKLIYIEPSPEFLNEVGGVQRKPNAIENALAAATKLPRYETIREDLQHLLERNRLIRRVNRRLKEAEMDIKQDAVRWENNQRSERKDWTLMFLDDMAREKGYAFLPYYRLRISALTAYLTKLVTELFGFDKDSDYFWAISCLVFVWRDENYSDYKPPEGEAAKESLNKFLHDFDMNYRLRRLRFVLQKADTLLTERERLLDFFNEHPEADFAEQRLRNDFRDALIDLRMQLADALAELQKDERRLTNTPDDLDAALKDFHSKVREVGNEITPASLDFILDSEKKISPEDFALDACRGRVEKLRKQTNNLEKRFEDAAEGLKKYYAEAFEKVRKKAGNLFKIESQEYSDWLNNISGRVDRQSAEAAYSYLSYYYQSFDDFDQVSFPIYYETPVGEAVEVDVVRISPQDAKSLIDEERDTRRKLAGDAYYAFGGFLDEVWRANDIMWGRLDGAERLITALLPDTKNNDLSLVRKALVSEAQQAILQEELLDSNSKTLRELFVAVLLRVSAGATPAEAVERAAETLNDNSVGDLQSIFRSFLNDPAVAKAFRERLEHRLLLTNGEISSGDLKENFRANLIEAISDSLESEAVQTALQKHLTNAAAVKSLSFWANRTTNPQLRNAVASCLEGDKAIDFMREHYSVERRLAPQPVLQTISRSTQIIGKVMEKITEHNAAVNSRVVWLSRLGQFFWGFLQIAAPDSLFNLLTFHWLKLLYFFEALLIIGGTLLVRPEIQSFGILALVLTAVFHFATLLLSDVMRGRSIWRRLSIILILIAGVVFVAGVFFLIAFFGSNSWWQFLTDNRSSLYKWFWWLAPLAGALAIIVFLLLQDKKSEEHL